MKKRPRLEAQSSGPSLVDAVAESGRQLLEGVRALLQSEGLTPATRQQVGTLIYDLQSEVGRGVSAAATCPRLALLLEDHSGEAEGAEDEEEEGEEEDRIMSACLSVCNIRYLMLKGECHSRAAHVRMRS